MSELTLQCPYCKKDFTINKPHKVGKNWNRVYCSDNHRRYASKLRLEGHRTLSSQMVTDMAEECLNPSKTALKPTRQSLTEYTYNLSEKYFNTAKLHSLVILAVLSTFLFSSHSAFSQPLPDFEYLADCIHRIENGTFPPSMGKGEQYGIHSVHYKDEAEARQICIRTCKHKFREWQLSRTSNFLSFLSKKYCPKNSQVWYRNLTHYYNQRRSV